MCIVSVLPKLQSQARLALPGDWEYMAKYTHEVPDSLHSHLGGGMRGQSQLGRHPQTGQEKKGQLEGPAAADMKTAGFLAPLLRQRKGQAPVRGRKRA